MVLAQQRGGHGAPSQPPERWTACVRPCVQPRLCHSTGEHAPSRSRSVGRLLAPGHHVHSSCLHAQSSLCQVPDVQSQALGQREVTSSVCHLLVP